VTVPGGAGSGGSGPGGPDGPGSPEGPSGPAAPDDEVLAGRYRLEERIGVGAMGEVWRARDLRLQRDVAVKRVRLDGHIDPAAQARFEREAVAMAGVSHPNVVLVYDAGTAGDDGRTAYLVMELLDGPSCSALIGEGSPLPIEEVERIGLGVARGLAAAHAAGVVHRDIKPGNVVVSRGVPKIVDFGIARLEMEATSTLTAPQMTIGTAAYMSPEQAMGKPVGPSSDVYSLGALVVALASGSPPFGVSNSLALMRAHIDDAPPLLTELREDASPALAALVERMLAKDPADRPTAVEAVQVLEGGELADPGEAPTEAVPPPTAPLPAATEATQAYAAPASAATALVPGPAGPAGPVAAAGAAPAPGGGEPPATRGDTDRRRRGGLVWWALAAALLVVGLVLAADALRGGADGQGADAEPTATAPATQDGTGEQPEPPATDAPETPTDEPATEDPPVEPTTEPEPEPDTGATLEEAVTAVGAAISAVEDDDAREDLTKAWQPASSGLQGANAADRLREVQREADDLLADGELTTAERDSVSNAIEEVIARL
jgi:eukaryotic-like serine/threonine-protein kinase